MVRKFDVRIEHGLHNGMILFNSKFSSDIFVFAQSIVMYVPAGFPHTTDTSTVVKEETVPAEDGDGETDLFKETSVHLTMGLDTHVWALTFAHLRWTLLQRCGKDWKVEMTVAWAKSWAS